MAHTDHTVSVFDTECYRDYFLCKFDTGEVFQLAPDITLDIEGLRRTLSRYTLVSFNGLHYDVPIISLALQGHDNATLKAASDQIIVGNARPWDITRDLLEWCDHIDMIEVAPGQSSLKMYGAKMHSHKLQDLPIRPDASIAWYDRVLLRDYCDNDLRTTRELYDMFQTQLELRKDMTAEHGVDLRSKSDAQISEAVMKQLLPFKVERPYIAPGTQFKYQPPEWLRFQHLPILQLLDRNVFKVAVSGSVEMPDELANTLIRIGSSAYKMGIGGLHSTESQAVWVADDEYELTDHDVRGYYPEIMIKLNVCPPQIGQAFMTNFAGWKRGRDVNKAKADDPSLPKAERTVYKKKANSQKTLTNGTFGKLWSMWSIYYYPQGGIQVTITGQAALLMLIEMLELSGIQVVSVNTDGIVLRTRRSMAWLRDQIVAWWESSTGFETERTDYRLLASRDVNSYVAVKPDNTVKLKGAYAPPEPGPSGWPNPTGQVCVDAVVAYLAHGTPLHETVAACNDIRQFVYVRQVKGGGSYLPTPVPPKATTLAGMRRHGATGMANDELRTSYAALRKRTLLSAQYLGKAVRWYYATGSTGCIITPAGGLVARTDGCYPMMELPDEMPEDIDREWYVREAVSLLTDLGITYGQ